MKTIFEKTVEEIKEGVGNYTMNPGAGFSESTYALCRELEKRGMVDNYIKGIKDALALRFTIGLNNKYNIIVVGDGKNFSFWAEKYEGGDVPAPISSTFDGTFWHPNLYKRGEVPGGTPNSPKAPIVHTYPIGHFTL